MNEDSDFGLRTPDFGFRTLDCGLITVRLSNCATERLMTDLGLLILSLVIGNLDIEHFHWGFPWT